MENYWIIYSLLGLIVLWLWDFIKKVIIQKWWSKEVFLFTCFIFYLLFLWINFLLNWTLNFTSEDIKSAIIIWILDSASPIWVLTCFKYLNVSFALVFIRIISSIAVLIIWIFILWDNLSLLNIIWFIIWIVAIFLLSWFKLWQQKKFPLKWIIALIITTLSIIFSHSYFKYVVSWINVDNFMILKFSVSFLFIMLYILLRKKTKDFSISQFKLVTPLALVSGIIFTIHFLYLLPNIYLNWTLSLGYKILSYSLIVPIILSIIFYKDKITKTNSIAFILTIISLALFIV